MRTLEVLKVPPGQAVLDRHYDGVVSEHRADLRRHGLDDIGFERQKNEILRSRLVAGRHRAQISRDFLRAVGADELQPIVTYRLQMRALIHDSDRLA